MQVFLVLLIIMVLATVLRRTSRTFHSYQELAVFRAQPFASAFLLTTFCTWHVSILLYTNQLPSQTLIVFALILAAVVKLETFLFYDNFTGRFLKHAILFLAVTTFVQTVNPTSPIIMVFMFFAVVGGMCYCFLLAFQLYQSENRLTAIVIPLLIGITSLVVLVLIVNGSDDLAVLAFISFITTCTSAVFAWILYHLLYTLIITATLQLPIDHLSGALVTLLFDSDALQHH